MENDPKPRLLPLDPSKPRHGLHWSCGAGWAGLWAHRMNPKYQLNQVSIERLREFMRHDDGHLYWTVIRGKNKPGSEVGSVKKDGYRGFRFDGRDLLSHRVIWAIEHGEWPSICIDHINGDRLDNRLCNLRLATNQQNTQNRVGFGAVKFKGVAIHTKTGKFQAICARRYIGLFESDVAAAKAYDAAARIRYGAFARLNFPESSA